MNTIAKDSTAMLDLLRESKTYVSPYEKWKESQGLPTIRGYFVKDLFTLDLVRWESSGSGKAVFINMDGAGGFNDAYVCEIPAGKALNPHRHLFEEIIYILNGHGATSVWLNPESKQSFEWQKGSFFAIPMNAWHQHFNVSGSEPARYIAVTSAPRVINTFDNLEFVFDNPFVFTDRFNGEEGYFRQGDILGQQRRWLTNFIADVANCQFRESVRGPGRALPFGLVSNTIKSHSQLWPLGIYTKAHRHGPGIHVLILRGHGYSLMWQEGKQFERIDWAPGSMFVPPEMWFHQHFNAGAVPVQMLAIGWGSDKPKSDGKAYVYSSVKEGGDQIDFEDEDPKIHEIFEDGLAMGGVLCEMDEIHAFCTRRAGK